MHAAPSRSFTKSSTYFAATSAALALAILLVTPVSSARAQTLAVIHVFGDVATGAYPEAGLAIDAAGNLYGTTSLGGSGGAGVVFRLKRSGSTWIISPLHSFAGGSDGNSPQGRVVLARDGTLYGTTMLGGGNGCLSFGCGTVFHLTPPPTAPKTAVAPWNITIIHSFNGTDGFEPQGDLTFDPAGNIYGATLQGGVSGGGQCLDGCGVTYELTHSGGGWTETVLYAAQGNDAGNTPVDGVVLDSSGNLYGALEHGGPFNWGLLYQLSPSGSGWTEQPAYTFSGGSNGGIPLAGLIANASGNFYGTTSEGGCGTVFEPSPSGGGWNLTTIYTFLGEPDGCDPQAKLAMDAAGSLYGTTFYGGQGSGGGAGTVFKLTPAGGGWTYSQIHAFTGVDGAYPMSSLVFDAQGNLYGTTTKGGASNEGVVFEITP